MIAVTTKHALKTMLYLEDEAHEGYVKVKDLARAIKIPSPYLSKIIKTLERADFVAARRGPGGGVKISDRGKKVSFYEVCEVLLDPITLDACFLSRQPCSKHDSCALHSYWSNAKKSLIRFLKHRRINSWKGLLEE